MLEARNMWNILLAASYLDRFSCSLGTTNRPNGVIPLLYIGVIPKIIWIFLSRDVINGSSGLISGVPFWYHLYRIKDLIRFCLHLFAITSTHTVGQNVLIVCRPLYGTHCIYLHSSALILDQKRSEVNMTTSCSILQLFYQIPSSTGNPTIQVCIAKYGRTI